MKTEIVKVVRNAIVPVLLLCVVSCRQYLEPPPVMVSSPVCLLTSEYGTFQHAGISFECCNIGNRTVSSINVSFLVFISKDGGNPFYGSNAVTSDVSMNLAAGESGLFEISLDSKLALIPSEPFLIDCFYVRKVVFDDGSEWTDPLGFYYAGSLPS